MTNLNLICSEVDGKCPFCGRDVSFRSNPKPFAAHELPTCETYERLDALEFIEAVNETLTARDPSSRRS